MIIREKNKPNGEVTSPCWLVYRCSCPLILPNANEMAIHKKRSFFSCLNLVEPQGIGRNRNRAGSLGRQGQLP